MCQQRGVPLWHTCHRFVITGPDSTLKWLVRSHGAEMRGSRPITTVTGGNRGNGSFLCPCTKPWYLPVHGTQFQDHHLCFQRLQCLRRETRHCDGGSHQTDLCSGTWHSMNSVLCCVPFPESTSVRLSGSIVDPGQTPPRKGAAAAPRGHWSSAGGKEGAKVPGHRFCCPKTHLQHFVYCFEQL